MIILDTNVFSHLQVEDMYGDRIEAALAASADRDVRITTITSHEAIKGAVEFVAKKLKDRREMVAPFRLVDDTLEELAAWRGLILPYDDQAQVLYRQIPAPIRKPIKADGWIAAIARRHNATIWTRNVRDFLTIPGLAVVEATTGLPGRIKSS